MNYDSLLAIQGTPASLAKLLALLRFVRDPNAYAGVPTISKLSEVRKVPFPADVTPQLLDAGIIERCSLSQVCGTTIWFGVPEFLKRRFRIIQWPRSVNDALPLPEYPVSFKSIFQRCQLVHAGPYAGTCDFAAFFTQFVLDPRVRARYAARFPVGVDARGQTVYELFRQRVAPTGAHFMPAVGIAVTEHLKAFPMQSAAHDDHIDNVLFVGDFAAVVADLVKLGERCKEACVTVNEDIDDPTRLVSEVLDWCGLRLDFKNKSVSLINKTTAKIEVSWHLRESWTWRGFAAHIGLLRYADIVLDCCISDFWKLHSFVSGISRWHQEFDNQRYDEPALIPPHVLKELEKWTFVALANKPRLVHKEEPPDVIAAVDSCASGWGYAALDLKTEKLYWHASAWSNDFAAKHHDKLHRSVLTEPYGLLFAKQHLARQNMAFARGVRRNVKFFSDNVATIATFRRGYASRSFDMNLVAGLDRHNAALARHGWSYCHIAGKDNVFADALSRGRMGSELTAAEQVGMREFLLSLARPSGGNPIGGHQAVVGVGATVQ